MRQPRSEIGSHGPHLRQSAAFVGFGAGAAIGAAGHLAGLDGWALVPICAGIGGGVASGIAWAWSRRGHAGPPRPR